MLTQSQFSQIQFVGKLDNLKAFYNSLKAINFNEDVNLILTEDGLRAIVEDAKYVQASVYVSRKCFSEYRLLRDEQLSIRVNLTVVCECLSIFSGVDCSMKMIYKGDGAPLVFVLEQHGEDDLVTECSVKTKTGGDPIEFTIDEDDASYNKIIVQGPEFSTLVTEINKSADELEINLSVNEPYFRMTTLGVVQSESIVEVAKTSDMILLFQCTATTLAKYKWTHFRMAMKAIALAMKIALTTDSSGLLALQIMVSGDLDAEIHIEFFISPLF